MQGLLAAVIHVHFKSWSTSLERVSIAFIFDAITNVKIFVGDKVISEKKEPWSKPSHEREVNKSDPGRNFK